MQRFVLLAAAALVACGGNADERGRQALADGEYLTAVVALHEAVRSPSSKTDVVDLYRRAVSGLRGKLRGASTDAQTCDEAAAALAAIEGFGEAENERFVLAQAYMCAARHRARDGSQSEAAAAVLKGMERLPGFSPTSPVLAKALIEPATKAARAGKAVEGTGLAQALFSSGKRGLALSLVDLAELSGASREELERALRQRQTKANESDAADAMAAAYLTWHDHPDDAAQIYDAIKARAKKSGGGAGSLGRYAHLRAEEATRMADNSAPACSVVADRIELASGIPFVQATAITEVQGSFLVAWIEGEKAPAQKLRVVRVGGDGQKAAPVTIANDVPMAPEASPDDPRAAFAPKNREASLALLQCGGVVEVAGRGTPEATWFRATLGKNGTLSSPATVVPPLGESYHLPGEDVYWNVACAGTKLVHIWLADTQLMRLAWFDGGVPDGVPANLRLPGFSPWFEATGRDDGATLLTWVDIVGQGRSRILWIPIPEDHEIPMNEVEDEETATPAIQPVIDGIDGRVEHMRLDQLGGRLALTYLPQGGDIMIRWIDPSGRPMGNAGVAAQVRLDAPPGRFDAGAGAAGLGLAWTEQLTDLWARLYFRSLDEGGAPITRTQLVSGLVRPDLPPLVAGAGQVFIVAWVDRSADEGEGIRATLLRCGQ